jgi:polysaccharide pyruvyl transferase WcaK-like protein
MKNYQQIALLGNFGSGNLGNEGSLFSMLKHIQQYRSSDYLKCICTNPDIVMKEHHINAVALNIQNESKIRNVKGIRMYLWKILKRLRIPIIIADWYWSFRCLKNIDAMIIPGTGILDDFCVSPMGIPYDLFRWCVVAKIYKIKTLFISVGAGPIHHPVSRWLMKSATKTACYRSYRDNYSKEFMENIGLLTKNDEIAPDLVFSIKPRNPVSISANLRNKKIVGVGIMNYLGFGKRTDDANEIYSAYINKVSEFIVELCKKGYFVRLLIGDVSSDNLAIIDILNRIDKLDKNSANNIVKSDPIQSISDLIKEISSSDIVVATRFHNLVYALILRKPVVSFGYAPKNDELLKDIELEEYVQQVEKVNISKLIYQVDQAYKNMNFIEQKIDSKLDDYNRCLNKQFEKIYSIIYYGCGSFMTN